jgi:ribonuclease Z
VATTITITGSGMPIPSPHRAGPGVLVRHGDAALQVDVGRSTVQRLAQCGVAPRNLTAVLVTHHHSDHLTGLQDLVLTRWTVGGDGLPPLPIVAPNGPATRFLARMLECWDDDIAVRNEHRGVESQPGYDVIGFEVPTDPACVWASGEVRVLAGPVRHEPVRPAVGYRIETPDGVVAITGDTRVCDEVLALADGADVLVYEAIRVDVVRRWPPASHRLLDYHADTRLIGGQAAALDIDTLVLTHLIPAPVTDDDRQGFVDDVRGGGYRGDLVVADDLTTIEL